jgi:hypothetical protein
MIRDFMICDVMIRDVMIRAVLIHVGTNATGHLSSYVPSAAL